MVNRASLARRNYMRARVPFIPSKRASLCASIFAMILRTPLSGQPRLPVEIAPEQVPTLARALASLAERHNADPDVLFGVAELYRFGGSSGLRTETASTYHQRVLTIQPTNAAALAVTLERRVQWHIDELDDIRHGMARAADVERGTTAYPTNSGLYEMCQLPLEERQEVSAVWMSRCRTKSEQLVPEWVSLSNALAQAEKVDPHNALWDYLNAAVLIWRGATNAAIASVRRSAGRQRLDVYASTSFRCRRKVLALLPPCPWPEKGDLMASIDRPGPLLGRYVAEPLCQLADASVERDPGQAAVIYSLLAKSAQMLLKSAIPGYDVLAALNIEERVVRGQEALYQFLGDDTLRMAAAARRDPIARRREYVLGVFRGPRPSWGDAQAQEEYWRYTEAYMQKGELGALEEWLSKRGKRGN
jgi:hypothetical protein